MASLRIRRSEAAAERIDNYREHWVVFLVAINIGGAKMMRRSRLLLILAVLVIASVCVSAQELAREAEQQSEMSRILKSSGSLLLRESHYLPDVETMTANDIECRVLIVKDLLSVDSKSTDIAVGLVLTIEEKYSEKTAYVDPDEIDGLIASIEYIDREGVSLVSQSILTSPLETSSSSEIHFTTKDGTVLGVVLSSDKLLFAIKVTSTADWVFLTDRGKEAFLANLRAARNILDSI